MKLNNIEFINKTIQRNTLKSNKKALISDVSVSEKEKAIILEARKDHLINNRSEPYDAALERIIGNNDLMPINYLQLGYAASKPICRIHVKNVNGGNEGFGTGFLISPNLLMTNNHVFTDVDETINSFAEFNYQYTAEGVPAHSTIFRLSPSSFFYTNKELDFSVVAVNSTSEDEIKSLSDFDFLKLFEESGKALVSECLTIIQHPSGGLKQIAIRENKLLIADPESNFITYSTDTLTGSSGSPVFNDQWQVVALHHSGVPKKDANGNWLCKDGSIWRKGMDDSLIDWISNEGIRVSAIVRDLKAKFPKHQLITELLNIPSKITKLEEGERSIPKEAEKTVAHTLNNSSTMENKITFNLPIEISVGIGSATTLPVAAPVKDTQSNDSETKYVVEQALDPNYKNRNGYEPGFVTAAGFKIELTDLLEGQKEKLAPLLNVTADNKHYLHYYNFSVAINKHRRLCMMTAVNIDGNRLNPIKRENTKWILDPRMDEKYQTGPTVYDKNDLDRGHMVRRLDPVWGDHAEAANDDTFNFSNSTPQHKNLNQKTWLSLENYILEGAGSQGVKASVFTGPVFSEGDIPYRGVLLPLQFWKVAAMIKKDGTPSVTGYMLKQPDEIDDFRIKEGIREDGFGQFKTFQVPLQKIANLTGIAFDLFNKYDPLNGVDFKEATKFIEIESSIDIKL
jgi:endonuclease G